MAAAPADQDGQRMLIMLFLDMCICWARGPRHRRNAFMRPGSSVPLSVLRRSRGGCTHRAAHGLCVLFNPLSNTNFSSSLQTLLPGSSATGTDQGLAFVMNLEQTLCTWYLETTAVVPVRSVAIPLSYSELGNLLSSAPLVLWLVGVLGPCMYGQLPQVVCYNLLHRIDCLGMGVCMLAWMFICSQGQRDRHRKAGRER